MTASPSRTLCGTGQKQITFNQVQLDQATEYAAEDADVTLRLWHALPRAAAVREGDAGL